MARKEVSDQAAAKNGEPTLVYTRKRFKVAKDTPKIVYTRKRSRGMKDTVVRRVGSSSASSSNAACADEKEDKPLIPSIPIDIIFKILILLPADILHNVMRLVCRDWRNLINDPHFILAHLRNSDTGLLLVANKKAGRGKKSANFIHIDVPKISGRRTRRRRESITPFRPNEILVMGPSHGILHGCDGLILTVDYARPIGRSYAFCVMNPARKQTLLLIPPYHHEIEMEAPYSKICASVTRDMYKVVLTGIWSPPPPARQKCLAFVSTINAGKTTWRFICLGAIHPSRTSSVGGFVYWHIKRDPVMIAMDVETETLCEVEAPKEELLPRRGYPFTKYITSERFLIMPVKRRPWIWEFWALVDTRNRGEWIKLYDVDLKNQVPLMEGFIGGCRSLEPLFVVLKEDLVVFEVFSSDFFIGYRANNRSIFRFGKYEPRYATGRFFGHVQSLLPLKRNSIER